MCVVGSVITAWPVVWREPRQEGEQICEAPVANTQQPPGVRSCQLPSSMVPRISGVTMLSLATEGFKVLRFQYCKVLRCVWWFGLIDGIFQQIGQQFWGHCQVSPSCWTPQYADYGWFFSEDNVSIDFHEWWVHLD